MRKVLLRIVFDGLWRLESVGNELLVGYGWVIGLIVVIAIICLGLIWRATKDSKEVFSSLIFAAIAASAVAMIPVLGLPIAANGIPLFGYGAMLTIGFLTATWLASRRAARVGLDSQIIYDLMMWLLIPGIVGARIVYLLQNWDRVYSGKSGLQIVQATIALWDGGIVFYGCIIGGVLGMLEFCRRRKIRPLLLGDVLMPSLFIGLGFGRIGCFLYGCCFGAACSLPWAVEFPSDSLTFERLIARSEATGDQLLMVNGESASAAELRALSSRKDGSFDPSQLQLTTIPLHPTQLYSSTLAFALAGFLAWYFRRRPYDGAVLAIGAIMYPLNRFVLEIIRDDEPGRLNTGLTFSQLVSIGLFTGGLILLVWLQKRQAALTEYDPPDSTSVAQPK